MYEQVRAEREVFGDGTDRLLCASVLKMPPEMAEMNGRIQCVYLDPPFMTGETFRRKRPLGEKGWKKGSPSLTLPGYEDRFRDEKAYLRLLRRMIAASRELLKADGVFYLHLDWRMGAQARALCDRMFGKERFLNEIIWSYESGGRGKKYFPRKHDTILLYAKGPRYHFDLTRVPLPRGEHRRNHMARGRDDDGRAFSSIFSHGKEYRYFEDQPVYPGDVWTDIGFLQQLDPERTGYPSQKPVRLLERLLLPVTREGDWVADLCCGSGTTLAAAEKLGCHFAGMDANPAAVAVSLARLKAENLTVCCPVSADRTPLAASYDAKGGRLRMEGPRVSGDPFPEGTAPGEALERWETGRLEQGVFRVSARYQRSFRYPALVTSLQVPAGELPDIMTTDAAGVRRAYRWKGTV